MNDMGELINLEEYRRKKEEEEIQKLREELKQVMDRIDAESEGGWIPLSHDVMSYPVFGEDYYRTLDYRFDYEFDGYDWPPASDCEINTWDLDD